MQQLSPSTLLEIIDAQVRLVGFGTNLSAVIDEASRVAVRLTAADGAVVELLEGEEIVYRSASGIAEAQLGLRMPVANSLSGYCLLNKTAATCTDSEADERVNRVACRKVGLRAMVIVPLIAGDQAIAVMKLVWREPRPLDNNEVDIAQLLANMCAALMHQAALEGTDVMHRRLTVDGDTGIANRNYFFEKLRARLLATAHVGVGLVRIETDYAANLILRCIETECREGDFVARVSANEFAIIMSMAVRRSVVESQLLRISHAVSRAGFGAVRSGSAFSPDDGASAADLFFAATAALTRS
ncbi:MAG TPA: GAF domain-containing protein [Pseudoduganella sp.]